MSGSEYRHYRDTETFLNILYPNDIPQNTQILIWTKNHRKPGGLSHWFQSLDEIHKSLKSGALKKLRRTNDLYIGEGLMLSRIIYGNHRRGTQGEVCGCAALSCDLDIKGPTHKKSAKRLFQSQEEAMEFIKFYIPWYPTIIVHSGGGLQCWWVFDEPWVFIKEKDGITEIDTEQQKKCAILRKMFNRYIQRQAQDIGRSVDSTFNLDRSLRLPGSFNCKKTPTKVYILDKSEEFRYDPDTLYGELIDFTYDLPEAQVVEIEKPATDKTKINFKIPDNAPDIDWDKLQVILENDEQFVKTWNHDRDDLEDQSQSSYDMAIAIALLQGGWDEQEIVNALIWNRLQYHPETAEKTKRTKYYLDTLEKAKIFIASKQISENNANINSSMGAPKTGTKNPKIHTTKNSPNDTTKEHSNTNKENNEDTEYDNDTINDDNTTTTITQDDLKESARQFLREITCLPVSRIIKLGQDRNAEFTIEMTDGAAFTIGDIKKLVNMNEWMHLTVLYDNSDGLMVPVAPEVWRDCCKHMKVLIEQVEVAEPNQSATMKDYLRTYYEVSKPKNWHDMDEDEQYMTLVQSKPFIKGFNKVANLKHVQMEIKPTHFCFNINSLQRFIKNNIFDNIPRRDIVNLLAKIGATKKRISATNKSGEIVRKRLMAIRVSKIIEEGNL